MAPKTRLTCAASARSESFDDRLIDAACRSFVASSPAAAIAKASELVSKQSEDNFLAAGFILDAVSLGSAADSKFDVRSQSRGLSMAFAAFFNQLCTRDTDRGRARLHALLAALIMNGGVFER